MRNAGLEEAKAGIKIAREDAGSVLGSGRSGGGHGNPLQSSCLENSMDKGAWQAVVHGVYLAYMYINVYL